MLFRNTRARVALSSRILSLALALFLFAFATSAGIGRSTPRASAYAAGPTIQATPGIPGDGSRTFPETGKTITGLFLDYWNSHGGLAQQGYPISDLMTEVSDTDGKTYTVQYFERAVFEYHPENQAPNNVLLSQLGTFQYKGKYPDGAPNQQPNNSAGSQLFTETGHRVGGKFLSYWQHHGGLAQQGYPISEEFQEKSDLDGKTYTVQYFERAVFEAHPENAAPYDVLLSQLGTFQYNDKYGTGQANGPVEGLFDVGGYKLWINCTGRGSPTVVMDSGLSQSSSDWSLVQPEVAKFTRACSYDRGGLGKSDIGPAPRTSAQTMKELHTLLAAARVEGPYVLVGQAEGGLNLQLFAKLYKSEVAGLVLVDAVHPDLDARYIAILTPEQEQEREREINQNREHATYADTHESGAEVRAAGPLPNVPLIVLRHGRNLPQPPGWPVEAIEKIWLQMQEELAAMIPGGKLIVAEQSRHSIEISQPDLVVQSIRDVIAAGKK